MIVSTFLSLVFLPAVAQGQPKQSAVEEALERLGADGPEVREKAFLELRNCGREALPTLKAALPHLKDPEVKARVELLLRILEPDALAALREHLAAAKVDVAAMDWWTDPLAEKVLPGVLFFQVWKKGDPSVWKLLGFDLEKRTLFDTAQEKSCKETFRNLEPADQARIRERLSKAASARHASLAAYPEVVSTLALELESPAVSVWVKSDGQTIEAHSSHGKSLWTLSARSALPGGVGSQVIRCLRIDENNITVIYGKHTFARVEATSGRVLMSGSD